MIGGLMQKGLAYQAKGDIFYSVRQKKDYGKLSGKKITDVGIVFTGLRPGEKMYEELFYKQEGLIKTEQKKIFKANGESTMNWYDIQQAVISLEHYCLERNENKLMKKVSQILSSEVDCVEHLGVA